MRRTWLLTLTLAAACGDDKNDPTATGSGTEGGSSGASTTSSSTTSGATNPTDNSGSMSDGQTMGGTTAMTSVGPTATSDATTMTATSGSSTGGGGEIAGACLDLCDKGVSECMIGDLGPSADLCAAECTGELGGATGACADATLAFLACLAGLDCAALEGAIVDEDFGPCLDAALALEGSCSAGDCTTEVAGDNMGTACSLTITCPDTMPQVMECEGKQCVCLVGEQMTGMCPAMDICMTPELLEDKAADCCGF